MIMFLLSTLIFTAISYLPEELSWLMLPAVILNGVGGITIVFTSFQFGNLFSAARSTVIAVMIGSYNASSFVYTLFLNLYRMGVSFPVLMLVHGGLLFIALIESWFNVPVKPIPTLEEQRSRKSPPRTSVRRNMAVQNNAFTIEEESEANESNEGSTDDAGQKLKIQTVTRRESIFAAAELNPPSFLAVIISWPCLLSLLTMCITQLRIVMFIGQLALFLRSSPDFTEETPVADREDKVTFYLTIFGWMQLFCLLVAPVIGKVLDQDLDTCRDDPIAGVRSRDSNSTNAFRRVQALRNTRNAYLITEACLLAIGVLMVLPIPIWAQYITFLLVTWIRTFLHSTAGGLYVNVFHYAHLGKLTGLGSIVSAVFCLLNDPLFKIVNNILDQDPFWLNILVLVLSLLGLLLPLYLTRFAKKVEKTLNEIDSRNKLSK